MRKLPREGGLDSTGARTHVEPHTNCCCCGSRDHHEHASHQHLTVVRRIPESARRCSLLDQLVVQLSPLAAAFRLDALGTHLQVRRKCHERERVRAMKTAKHRRQRATDEEDAVQMVAMGLACVHVATRSACLSAYAHDHVGRHNGAPPAADGRASFLCGNKWGAVGLGVHL